MNASLAVPPVTASSITAGPITVGVGSSQKRQRRAARLAAFSLTSLAILVPCFWQPEIEATDLPSHLYNAWLYTLVHAGKLPGITIAHQKTNILVDILLQHAMRCWGPWWAEHLVAALSVFVFFWGVFRFVAVLTRTQPWSLTPLMAMLAYGAIFRFGFLNFYLSLGLCLWAASFLWSRRLPDRILAFLLLCLAVVAHPMPPAWIIPVLAYICLARRLRPGQRPLLFMAGAAAIIAGRLVLQYRFAAGWQWISLLHPGTWLLLGQWQMLIYGQKYWCLCVALLVLWLWWLFRLFRRKGAAAVLDNALFQLLLLSVLASVLSPIQLELPIYRVPAGLLTFRASLLTAIVLCAVLAKIDPPRWEKAALAVLAALFFSFAYADERAINRFEARLQEFVKTLPPGDRAVAIFHEKSEVMVPPFTHILDRPCIGHCFDYGNYEPSTGQFRIRATQPNPYVLAAPVAANLEAGMYALSPQDPPLNQIHICDPKALRFCTTRVFPGQTVKADTVSIVPRLW